MSSPKTYSSCPASPWRFLHCASQDTRAVCGINNFCWGHDGGSCQPALPNRAQLSPWGGSTRKQPFLHPLTRSWQGDSLRRSWCRIYFWRVLSSHLTLQVQATWRHLAAIVLVSKRYLKKDKAATFSTSSQHFTILLFLRQRKAENSAIARNYPFYLWSVVRFWDILLQLSHLSLKKKKKARLLQHLYYPKDPTTTGSLWALVKVLVKGVKHCTLPSCWITCIQPV